MAPRLSATGPVATIGLGLCLVAGACPGDDLYDFDGDGVVGADGDALQDLLIGASGHDPGGDGAGQVCQVRGRGGL